MAGDIDGDGDVGTTDNAKLLSGYTVSTCTTPSPLTAAEFERADYNPALFAPFAA